MGGGIGRGECGEFGGVGKKRGTSEGTFLGRPRERRGSKREIRKMPTFKLHEYSKITEEDLEHHNGGMRDILEMEAR